MLKLIKFAVIVVVLVKFPSSVIKSNDFTKQLFALLRIWTNIFIVVFVSS